MRLVTKAQARLLGAARGKAAASWVFDGNTKQATYQRFLKMLEDGEPFDAMFPGYSYPEWLSGEWAGESVAELLGECVNARDEERLDGVMEAYEAAADVAYWSELERVARFHVECVA